MLFSLKISLVSNEISFLTSVGFSFPRLQLRVRVEVDLVIICAAVWCSYYSWTEFLLKLRNMSLAAVSIPETALCTELGSFCFLRDSAL